MVAISFITADNKRYEVEAATGATLMEVAVKNSVPGIEAECGGACSCATCHVYLTPEGFKIVGEPGDMEEDMLDFAVDVRPESRLSCQIKITDELDGLEVFIPASQG